MKHTLPIIACAAMLAGLPAYGADRAVTPPAADATRGAVPDGWTAGEVRKIDADRGAVTLKHGAIKNLDMPPMTMVFKLKEATMLARIKVGDQVRFKAENIGGALTVTTVEAIR